MNSYPQTTKGQKKEKNSKRHTPALGRLLRLEVAYSVHSFLLFFPPFLYVIGRIFQPTSHCTEGMNSLASSHERGSIKVASIICNLIYIDRTKAYCKSPGKTGCQEPKALHNFRRYPVSESIFKYKSSRWEDFNSFIPVFNSVSCSFPNLVLSQAGTAFQKIMSERTGCIPLLTTRTYHTIYNVGIWGWIAEWGQ